MGHKRLANLDSADDISVVNQTLAGIHAITNNIETFGAMIGLTSLTRARSTA